MSAHPLYASYCNEGGPLQMPIANCNNNYIFLKRFAPQVANAPFTRFSHAAFVFQSFAFIFALLLSATNSFNTKSKSTSLSMHVFSFLFDKLNSLKIIIRGIFVCKYYSSKMLLLDQLMSADQFVSVCLKHSFYLSLFNIMYYFFNFHKFWPF